jgi:hypothetical protein
MRERLGRMWRGYDICSCMIYRSSCMRPPPLRIKQCIIGIRANFGNRNWLIDKGTRYHSKCPQGFRNTIWSIPVEHIRPYRVFMLRSRLIVLGSISSVDWVFYIRCSIRRGYFPCRTTTFQIIGTEKTSKNSLAGLYRLNSSFSLEYARIRCFFMYVWNCPVDRSSLYNFFVNTRMRHRRRRAVWVHMSLSLTIPCWRLESLLERYALVRDSTRFLTVPHFTCAGACTFPSLPWNSVTWLWAWWIPCFWSFHFFLTFTL